MTVPAATPTPSATSTVDDTDLRLLRALERDGRASVMHLAAELGLSRSTIHTRLSELREQDAFRVVGLVHPGHLGRPVVVVFVIRAGGNPSDVLSSVWQLPEIRWASSMTDAKTIMAQAAFPHLTAVSEFLDQRLRRHPGVWDVEPHVITSVYNSAPHADTPVLPAWYTADSPRPLDPIDLSIAQALQADGRMPFARIADTAGLSVAAVRQRALKLVTAGIVQIKTLVNPAMVGLRGLGVVGVTVRGDASAITRKITELDGVHYVDQTLGTYAVLAQFHCPSLSDLAHRRQQIDQIEGVRSTELFQLHESPSYGGSWA